MRAERTVRVGAVFCGRDDDAEGPFAPGAIRAVRPFELVVMHDGSGLCGRWGGRLCVCVDAASQRGGVA